jgi:glycine/D-amino acid oxidase-like deaminating enzyme
MPTHTILFLDLFSTIGYRPAGNFLRVTALGEIAGYESEVEDCAVGPTLDRVRQLYGHAVDMGAAKVSACFRPATPDFLPIVGPAPRLDNVVINTGHGQAGWTTAAGSGLLAALHVCSVMGIDAFSPNVPPLLPGPSPNCVSMPLPADCGIVCAGLRDSPKRWAELQPRFFSPLQHLQRLLFG